MKASQWIQNILNGKYGEKQCPIDWKAVKEIDEMFFSQAILINKNKELKDQVEELDIMLESTKKELQELKYGKNK